MRTLVQFFYPSNQLSLLRLVIIPFVVLSILYSHYQTAFVLVFIAGVSDGMDGLLARRLGQQTTLGKFLDPLADKLFLNSAFAALGFAHEIPLWLVVLVLSRDVIIITISLAMLLASAHRPFPPSAYGKANTGAQIATVLLTLCVRVFPSEILGGLQQAGIYCTAGLTIASGFQYAFRAAEQFRGPDLEAAANEPRETRQEPAKHSAPVSQNRLD